MLKFSVSARSLDLPVDYLKTTCRKSLEGIRYSKSMVALSSSNELSQQQMRRITDTEMDREQTDNGQHTSKTLGRTVSTRMHVWSNQLSRLKKKTDTLRRKDVEIREKYKQLKKKAKMVFTPNTKKDQSAPVMDEATPVKRAKIDIVADTFYIANVLDQTVNELSRPSRKVPIPREKTTSIKSYPPRRAFCFVESPNRGLVPVGWRKILSMQRRHKSESSIPSKTKSEFSPMTETRGRLSPIPYPRTFLKDGKKCTFC